MRIQYSAKLGRGFQAGHKRLRNPGRHTEDDGFAFADGNLTIREHKATDTIGGKLDLAKSLAE